jgi:hypothetical protein
VLKLMLEAKHNLDVQTVIFAPTDIILGFPVHPRTIIVAKEYIDDHSPLLAEPIVRFLREIGSVMP